MNISFFKSSLLLLITFCLLFLITAPVIAVARQETDDATKLISKSEIARMNFDQFMDAYSNRAEQQFSEVAYDNAAYYYTDVKESLHDRAAGHVSHTLLRKIRLIRKQLAETEFSIYDNNATAYQGTMYTHMENKMCASREDVVGKILTMLITSKKQHGNKDMLLARLRSLDKQVLHHKKPCLKLASEISWLPPQAIRIILREEQDALSITQD